MKREMVRARGLTGEEEGSKGIMTRGGGDRGRGDRSDTSDHRDDFKYQPARPADSQEDTSTVASSRPQGETKPMPCDKDTRKSPACRFKSRGVG